ncbi:hypothetical protein COSO111634_33030 [Corallococcus soli]
MPSAPRTLVGRADDTVTSPSRSSSLGRSLEAGALVWWGRFFTEAKMGRQASTKRRTSSRGSAGE